MSPRPTNIRQAKPGDLPQGPKPASLATAAVCALLLAAVVMVFGRTIQYGFVNFDDDIYLYDNPHVTRGLAPEGVAWALTANYANNWHPLTWFSHMLDWQIYGHHAGGHHLSSVLIHAASAIVLFLVMRRMTGGFWPSALAAAVFAVHPLHVESVAWVAERKDILSGLFFVLTLGAYVRYVGRPSAIRYLLVVVLFGLGLMSKPMVVTLPLVLLLLDYWPLGRMAKRAKPDGSAGVAPSRFGHKPLLGLVVEKIPLLLLTAAFCVTTVLTQAEAVRTLGMISPALRVENALASYISYLEQCFYPVNLAVFYPHPGAGLASRKAAAALVVLLAISLAAVAYRRRAPYLLVGWLWFVGMLVPVIGLVQVGSHAMADRYMYLPQIGLCIALGWGVAQVSRSWSRRRWICGVAGAQAVAALMVCAWRQTAFWRDSETLWRHALACTERSPLAHLNLGRRLMVQSRVKEAIAEYEKAWTIQPLNIVVCADFTAALATQERLDKAAGRFQKSPCLRADYADAYGNFADILEKEGRIDEAIDHDQEVLNIRPDDAKARQRIADMLQLLEEFRKAIAQRRELLRQRPNNAALLGETAWMLATNPNASLRNGAEAVELAARAVQVSGASDPSALDALAAAYAEAGRFPEALQAAHKALELAAQRRQPLAEAIAARIQLYEAGVPFREM